MSKKNRSRWPQPSQPSVAAAPSVSLAQLEANRANAQLSSGPRTPEGKAISSRNALKTGLTGRIVLLPNEDASEYQQHLNAYVAELAPIGQRETDLVQSIADTAWRLKRIPSLEAGIYAIGRADVLAERGDSALDDLDAHLINAAIHLKYERQLRNLQLQESRLVRRREKEIAELRLLQRERNAAAEADKVSAPEPAITPVCESVQALPGHSRNGFVFSDPTAETEAEDSSHDDQTLNTRSKAA